MKTDWNASFTKHEKGSILFEKCDINPYTNAAEEYERLSSEEKSRYKGMDHYV